MATMCEFVIGGLSNAAINFGAVECSPAVFRIWEVPGPIFFPQIRYYDMILWLSCQVCRYTPLKQTTTASFHILPNSYASAYTFPHNLCSGEFVVKKSNKNKKRTTKTTAWNRCKAWGLWEDAVRSTNNLGSVIRYDFQTQYANDWTTNQCATLYTAPQHPYLNKTSGHPKFVQ
jgi:hypothetical protein